MMALKKSVTLGRPNLRKTRLVAVTLMTTWMTFGALAGCADVVLGADQGDAAAISAGEMPAVADVGQASEGVRLLLSGGTFDQRQRAMYELWRERAVNREAVAQATRDADPEVATRAQWILDRWRRGILPETPLELARQLEAMSHTDSLQRLLDRGMFSGALIAVDEAMQTGDEATLSRVSTVVQRGFPFYIRSADSLDQMDNFAMLVARLAVTPEMIVCRNQMWRLLGKGDAPAFVDSGLKAPDGDDTQPEQQPVLEVESNTPPLVAAIDRERVEVIALASANRLDEAIERAKRASDPELLRVCQLLRGDWAELATTQAALAREHQLDTEVSDRHWAYVLVAAARSGDAALRAEAIEKLSLRPSDALDEAADDPFVRLRWQVLALHGEVDAAVEILSSTQPLTAAELLAQSGSLLEAMKLAGLDPDDIDGSLGKFVEEAQAASSTWNSPRITDVPEPLERLITIARLLYQGGRRDASFDLFSRAALAPPMPELSNVPMARAFVLQSLLRLSRPEWLAKILNQEAESSLSGTGRHYLARAFDVQPETIDALTIGISQVIKVGETELPVAIYDFLAGETPEGFKSPEDYQRLFELLTGQETLKSRQTPDQPFRLRTRPAVRINLEIAKLFQSHGQLDLAKRCLVELAAMGDTDAMLEYAEAELTEGRVQSARTVFETVWGLIDTVRQNESRLNRAEDDAKAAMRAILGEAVAAGRLGDVDAANELWRLIDLMACSPSAKLRNAFGDLLIDQGYDERAEAIYRILGPWIAFGSDEGVEFYSVARNFSRALGDRNPSLAADVFDLAIAGTIESTVFYPAAYISLPAFVSRMKVNAAIAQGDETAIRNQVDEVLRMSPMDIDFGEKAIKKIRDAGLERLADETIERIYVKGKQYMEQFPLDIVTANNLAWIMALSEHRLEEALSFSQRAVYLAPDSTVYRDTLAEVLFRLRRIDEAIAMEEACLIDEPGEWHTHEQLRRFRAAAKQR